MDKAVVSDAVSVLEMPPMGRNVRKQGAGCPGKETEMERYVIKRTGNAPLVFRGELLAEQNGARHCGKDQNRYHNLRVYRTEGGNHVGEIEFLTWWEGESDYHEAGEATDLGLFFLGYSPGYALMRSSKSPQQTEPFWEAEGEITFRYEYQVGELLADHTVAEIAGKRLP
ncbi:MAG: hypothetical protein H3C30_11685 [Candidatus Hydrogenedentes bacterium]|nr:hypothetical protein [Candidatus Hydrogenedentota bacterium]